MSSQESDEGPPRPRLTLRVGITGKRAMPETERDRIRKSLAGIFESLAQFLIKCRANDPSFFAESPPLLRVISGMAEGADQLAAEAAIERNKSEPKAGDNAIETRLAAILPFAQAEYEEDFKQDPNRPKGQQKRTDEEWKLEVERFRNLLKNPAVESVLQIDDESLLNTGNSDDRNEAYTNLRDLLLEHTDVLVAVSDDKYGGAGGTVDVIGIAVGGGIPVIKVSMTTDKIHVMRMVEPDAPVPMEDEELRPGENLPEKLALSLARTFEPPKATSEDSAGPKDEFGQHVENRPGRERLEGFFKEDFKVAYFGRVFKSLRDALAVEPAPNERFCLKAFAAFLSAWRKYRIDSPDQAAARMWPPDYDAFTPDGGKEARRVLARRYGWADALAVRYADATRSSHILIAALGALAVLVGLVTLVLWDKPDELAVKLKIGALVVEVAILLVAGLCFFRPAHKWRWHERMVDYRAVAELLRHERYIYALGAADRPGRTTDRTWKEPNAWVGWYVRATLRELGYPSKLLSALSRRQVLEAFLKDELEGDYGQIAYNQAVEKRFHTIDHRFEKFVRNAFWFTVLAAVFGIVLLTGLGEIVWRDLPGHGMADAVIHFIKPYFTVIAAFVPALIAAIHGVRFQLEFKSTAERAGATKRELLEVLKQVKIALLASPPSPGRKQSVLLVRSANEAMSSDLAGWSSVYRRKEPEL